MEVLEWQSPFKSSEAIYCGPVSTLASDEVHLFALFVYPCIIVWGQLCCLLAAMSSATTDPSSSASSRNSPCAICCLHPSKYTCPRCSVRTCSLACFNAHKKGSPSSINGTSDGGCSGERNKVAYVPPNKYGYGQMMDDYAFLEETRRKVEGWGTSSAVGGAAGASGPASTAGPQGKGKKAQHPQQQGGGAGAQARNDVLAREVQARLGGARVVFLPEGMQRRRLNQSGWNLK